MIQLRRKKRHHRSRARLHGTKERPRVSVFRSARHTTVQLIDDDAGRTLLTVNSTLDAKVTKVEQAQKVGAAAAAAALAQGVKQVVFDRSGYAYHGRVKAVADAMRAGGLDF